MPLALPPVRALLPRVPRAASPPAVSFAALAFALTLASAGCSSASTTTCATVATVSVQVTDEDVDDPSNFICNATVTLRGTSGGATQLSSQGADGANANCIYEVNEPAGTYTLSASKEGYTPGSQSVTVTSVSCATQPLHVVLGLYETQMGVHDGGLPDVNVLRMPDGGDEGGEVDDSGKPSEDAGSDTSAPPTQDAAEDAPDDATQA